MDLARDPCVSSRRACAWSGDELASRRELVQAAIDTAKRLRLSGPRALEQSKLAINMCSDSDLSTARKIGLEALAMLVDGAEWKEGISAFLEKREPRFESVVREANDRQLECVRTV